MKISKLLNKKLPFSKTISLIVFVLMMAVAIPVRTIQLLYFIDYSTGFYVQGDQTADILSALLNIVLWAGLIVIALLLFFGQGEYPETFRNRNKPLGFAAMAAGLCLLIRMGFVLVNEFPQVGRGVLDLSSALQIALLVLAAVALNAYGLKLIEGQTEKSKFGFLMLMPTFWAALTLMSSFMAHTTIANISENLFDILALSFTTIFLYTFTRVSMGYLGTMTETVLLMSGTMTAAFSLLSALPRFLILVAGDEVVRQYVATPDFGIFGMGIFSTAILLSYLVQRSSRYARQSKSVVSKGPETDIVE